MKYLIAANVMFVVAPFLYLIAERFRRLWHGIVRALMVAVTLIVVVHLLPESFEVVGWPSLLVFLVGVMIPSAIEKLFHGSVESVHFVSRIAVLSVVCLHTMADGAALAVAADEPGLSLAVVLHRIPDGVVVWGTFYPLLGWKRSCGLMLSLVAATILGFVLSDYLISGSAVVHDRLIPYLQAFIAGTLLHVIFHREPHDEHHHGRHGHHHSHPH